MAKNNRNARSVKNIFAPENKSKLTIIAAVVAGIVGYTAYLNSDDPVEIEPPAMQSSISKTKEINTVVDTQGQTQLTNETRQIEDQLNRKRIIDQIDSGESAIMDRKNELQSINYTPKQKLAVVETPKVETKNIQVEEAKETTPVQVEVKNNEVETTQAYREPSYAQINRLMIDNLKLQMGQTHSEIKQKDERLGQMQFATVDFSYFTQYKTDQATKAQAQSKATTIKYDNPLQYQARTNGQGDYIPSARLVNDNTALGGYNANEMLFRAGERVAGITLIKASNIQPGPILATLSEGQYAGAELMGTVTTGDEVLNFNFTSIWLPREQIRVPISAIALKFDDQTVGTQTNVNHRYFRKLFLKPALEGLAAAGQYYADDDETTTIAGNGTVVTSKAQKTTSTAKKVALGGMAQAMADQITDIDTRTIVTQDQYTPIMIMFMQDVYPNSNRSNGQSGSTQNVVSENINAQPAQATPNTTTATGEPVITLTADEARVLQGTDAEKNPAVKAAIDKALSK